MRDLLAASLLGLVLFAAGCGGATTDDAPAAQQCGPLPTSGWTWERRNGDCGDAPKLAQCSSTETHGATNASGVCEVTGDVMCGPDVVTVICEDGVCFAAVNTATCSGEYTLRVGK